MSKCGIQTVICLCSRVYFTLLGNHFFLIPHSQHEQSKAISLGVCVCVCVCLCLFVCLFVCLCVYV